MTRSQFVFSLGTGAALCAAGSALASSGIADWGLFTIGAMIAGLAIATQLRESDLLSRMQLGRAAAPQAES